ncbi:hypothetical protein HK097_011163 [Rhizophlyctis rosea]|uniref:FHA domain-containing protein n=1 Tax=Rhizophlyctis rosea TaxID=64517 RepID=A0AAD5WZD2_9FUNG|nr:hypothetical protein HK097_011163 [Rhizophlyctis rosea]
MAIPESEGKIDRAARAHELVPIKLPQKPADTLTASFHPLSNAFTQKRTIKLTNGQCTPIGRHTEGGEPVTSGLRFISKVVSRNHAVVFGVDGKLYIQDTKSSSGTFLNSQRLSPQQQESPRVELHDGDIIRLGEDCEVNGVLHTSILMKVTFNTRRLTGSSFDIDGEGEYVDFSSDPQVRQTVETEFNAIWSSLTQGLDDPLNRLRSTTRERAGMASHKATASIISNASGVSDSSSVVGAG